MISKYETRIFEKIFEVVSHFLGDFGIFLGEFTFFYDMRVDQVRNSVEIKQ